MRWIKSNMPWFFSIVLLIIILFVLFGSFNDSNKGEILSGIGSTFGALATLYIGFFVKEYTTSNRVDDQSKWVDKLLDVANTTDFDMSQKEVLKVLSCIRVFPKDIKDANNKRNDKLSNFDRFSRIVYYFCNSIVSDPFKILQYAAEIRLIANILLKWHWDYYQENKGKDLPKDIFDKFVSEMGEISKLDSKLSFGTDFNDIVSKK